MTVLVVYETHGMRRRTELQRVAHLQAAEVYLNTLAPVVLFEPDADHPGCADAVNARGQLFVVEPVDFAL